MARSIDSHRRHTPSLLPEYQAMLRYGRVALLCGLLALAAVAVGCQRGPTWKLASVEGTVTKDGRPLANIQVVFLPDLDSGTQGPRARGTTDETGHYRLRTDNGDDGIVVGKHRVLLFDLEAAKGQDKRRFRGPQLKAVVQLSPENAKHLQDLLKTAEGASRVSSSCGHPNETPLRAEVHPGPQTLDFDVPN